MQPNLANAIAWLLLSCVCAFGTNAAVGAGDSITPGGPDLRTTLEKGLRARRPLEFAFIGMVVNRVNQGTLPVGIVESTFLWARHKKPFPYPYFERGLKERAKKVGIAL